MPILPSTENSLLVRTNFADAKAWADALSVVLTENEDGSCFSVSGSGRWNCGHSRYFNFHARSRQGGDLDGASGWIWSREELFVDFVETGSFGHVGQINGQLEHIRKAGSCPGQCRLKVLQDLAGLLSDVAELN